MFSEIGGIVSVEEIPSSAYTIQSDGVLRICEENNKDWVMFGHNKRKVEKIQKKSKKEDDEKKKKLKKERKQKETGIITKNKIKELGYKESLNISSWLSLGLSSEISSAMVSEGFSSPTNIQCLAINEALRQNDILACAETGSGKTFAFALPVLNSFLSLEDTSFEKLPCLILTPTRELALQISTQIERVLKALENNSLRVVTVIGGLHEVKQERLLKRKPQIVVATPGRFGLFLKRQNSYLDNLSESLRFLIFDEADRLFEKGHFADLKLLLKLLKDKEKDNEESVSSRRTYMFSATLLQSGSDPKKSNLYSVLKDIGHNSIKVCSSETDLKKKGRVLPKHLNLLWLSIPKSEKIFTLYKLISHWAKIHPKGFKVIVFVNSVSTLQNVLQCMQALKLKEANGVCDVITKGIFANMKQKKRLKQLEQFTKAKTALLITTDVSARGIDFKDLNFVLNFDLPRDFEGFVHRAGRTARAGAAGKCYSLVDQTEEQLFKQNVVPNVQDSKLSQLTEDSLNSKFNLSEFKQLRQRASLVSKIVKLSFELKQVESNAKWYKTKSEETDLCIDAEIEDVVSNSNNTVEVQRKKKQLRSFQSQLLNTFKKQQSTSTTKDRKRKNTFVTINSAFF